MAVSKYFTVTVKPTITASIQAGGTVASGDILFDWTSFDIPKGAAKLTGVTVLMRGTNGARQEKSMDFYYAKTVDSVEPGSLGTLSATADGSKYQNHLIGANKIMVDDFKDGLDIMAVASSGHGAGSTQIPSLVLQGEPETGTNVGYDKLYVACVAAGALDFRSTVQCDGIQATSQAVLTVKTTSALTNFAVGDVLHDEDDRAMGTVLTVDSATQMTMAANLANATVNNKDLYNINPVTLILSFEK
tara:strand:- start:305 stop:1042 length:738 start_codon:yes stop_codon:yes gene_type:complete